MKFGMFYEHQCPQPWAEDSERRVIQEHDFLDARSRQFGRHRRDAPAEHERNHRLTGLPADSCPDRETLTRRWRT